MSRSLRMRGLRNRSSDSTGVLLAVSAYGLWGLFPLYFQLISAAGPVEIIGNRIFWSFVFCGLGIFVLRQSKRLWDVVRTPRLFWSLAGAGVLVSVNWFVYVWAVLNHRIVDAALGYFVNPLITVALAVIVLRERLRPAQIAAVGVGVAAVVVIAVGYGQVPWVALALAVTFGLYGLIKKRVGAHVPAMVGLTVETAVLSPIALAYLIWLQVVGASSMFTSGSVHTIALVSAGAVTAIPLLLFAGASSRIPLAMMGMIQYMTPVLQFLIGVWVNHETMPVPRWIGFGLVWVALVVLTVDSLRAARSRRLMVEPEIQD